MRRATHRTISLFTSLCLVALTVVGIVAGTAISASAAPPAADASFDGLRLNLDDGDPLNWGDDATPTPVIAVGPDHVVQVVNDTVAVFSKAGSLIDATDLPTFWQDSPAGTCVAETSDNYEANDVFYDSATDRWIVMTLSFNGAETAPYVYNECIAASKTGNPDGDYYYYSVPVLPGGSGGDLYFEAGATNYGLWVNDALWMTSQLGCDACPFRGTANDDVEDAVGNRVWAFNTADLESGSELRWSSTVGTGNLSGQNFPGQTGTTSGVFADVIIPATYNKASGVPPAGRNEFIAGIDFNATRNDVWRVDVNWATSVITVTANATQINNAYNANYNGNFDSWVTEPTPGNVLDTGYDYDIGRIVYANTAGTERLWATHGSWTNASPPNSGFGAIQWASWVVAANNAPTATGGQLQNFCGSATSGANTANCTSPDSIHRWLGSIGIDKLGNMGLNYNVTSPSLNVGLRYTGRLVGDTVNNLQSPDQTLVAGSGYQVGTVDGDPFTSFGGQTLSTIDPDGCTFWTTGEYFSSSPALPTNYDTDTWNTRIGAWHWSTCTPTALATAITTSGAGPAGGNGDLKATLTATGTGSNIGGKTINFTLGGNPVGSAVTNDNGVATLSGVDISAYAAGTNAGQVGASFAGTTAYGTSSNTGDLLASGATAQAITFTNPGAQVYGTADFNPGATSDSSLAVTYTATGDCSIVGGNAHLKKGGSCTVTAHQGGDATYAPADDVARTFAIDKANQTITFGALTGPTSIATAANTATGQLYVAATTTSNLPIRFSTNANCALTGLTHLYGTHAGSCTVTASQPGSDSYNAATPVAQSSTVAQGAQTATSSPNQATRTISQIDHQWTINWTSGAPSSTLTAVNAGPWTVTAAAGTGTVATLTLTPLAHNMQIGTHVTVTGQGAYNCTNCTLTAVAANTISYASAATGAGTGGTVTQSLTVCSNSGLDITVLHTGSCTVTATQAGTADYLPAGPTSFNKGITKGTFGNTTFSPAASSKPADTPFSVTATLHASNVAADPEISNSLNAGTLTSTTPATCSVGGTSTGPATSTVTVTPISNGTCTISASGTTGNDDWAARTAQSVNYTITKVNQTITFDPIADQTFPSPAVDLVASASSGLTVSFAAAGPCSIVAGPKVSIDGGGHCIVTASQAGNGIYNAATPVTQEFDIDAGGQTITITGTWATDHHTFGDADFSATATASSSLPVTFTASGDCTVTGDPSPATVHLTGGGSCTITAHQPGNDDYAAAPDVDSTFTVFLDQTINGFANIPNKSWGDPDFTFATGVTATSGLTVTYTTSGPCTLVSGPKVHITGTGVCTVTAHQAGNGSYNPAPDVNRPFTINARATKTTLKIAPKTVVSGGSITGTAKVSSVGVNKLFPQGSTVQFKVGASVLGTAVVNAKGVAKATFTVPLAPGKYNVIAVLVASPNFASSQSAANQNGLKVT